MKKADDNQHLTLLRRTAKLVQELNDLGQEIEAYLRERSREVRLPARPPVQLVLVDWSKDDDKDDRRRME